MLTLQILWFLLIGVLLTGYAILDGFDLGVGMLHLSIAKDDRERRILLNSIAPVWDGNEVWLLTGGGAIFAAFPKVYATVFSGLYLPLMLLLAALIVRAVSLEFRSKNESPVWRAAWDGAFALGSFLPALLLGVAIGNVMRGVPLSAEGEFAGSFFGLLNPFAVGVGLLSTSMFVMQGSSWLLIKTEGALRDRAARIARRSWGVFILLWAGLTFYSRTAAPHLWHNYRTPLLWIAPVVFLGAAIGYPLTIARRRTQSFAFSSVTIASLIAIMGQGLFPFMLPAIGNPASGLTISNASSSYLTLKVMLAIALLGMPAVLGYTIYIYRNFMEPVVLDEHSY